MRVAMRRLFAGTSDKNCACCFSAIVRQLKDACLRARHDPSRRAPPCRGGSGPRAPLRGRRALAAGRRCCCCCPRLRGRPPPCGAPRAPLRGGQGPGGALPRGRSQHDPSRPRDLHGRRQRRRAEPARAALSRLRGAGQCHATQFEALHRPIRSFFAPQAIADRERQAFARQSALMGCWDLLSIARPCRTAFQVQLWREPHLSRAALLTPPPRSHTPRTRHKRSRTAATWRRPASPRRCRRSRACATCVRGSRRA